MWCLPDMTERRDNLLVYQTRMYPPHFKVVIEDTVWNLKPVSQFHFALYRCQLRGLQWHEFSMTVPSGENSWRRLCPAKDTPPDDDDDDDEVA